MDKTMQQESETKPNMGNNNIRTPANTSDRVQNCYSEIPELSEPRYLDYALAATIHLVDRLNGMIEDEKHRFRFIENKIVRKQLQFNEIQSSIDYEKQDLAFSIKTRVRFFSEMPSYNRCYPFKKSPQVPHRLRLMQNEF